MARRPDKNSGDWMPTEEDMKRLQESGCMKADESPGSVPTRPVRNPPRDQLRHTEPAILFRKHGYCMFPQQRTIYRQLAERLRGKTVLEAGCGNGLGSAMLERAANRLVASDKLESNTDFAGELYPWIDFRVWDANKPCSWGKFHSVIAVEMIEHVEDPGRVLRNLMDAACLEVWISTPNGAGKPRPPENPFHVLEYDTPEFCAMIGKAAGGRLRHLEILNWETFEPVDSTGTEVNPLVYWVQLR